MIVYLNGNSFTTKYNNSNTVVFNNGDNVVDEVRGYLVFQNNDWVLIGVAQFQSNYKKRKKEKIALILESPHKDEFSANYVPIRPANGVTGKKIEKKIGQKANSWNLTKTTAYEINIINAIQFQCSCWNQLGVFDRKLRNSVFRVLFNPNMGNLKQHFIMRLQNYKPNIIVNACTYPMKNTIVANAIKASNNGASIYNEPHPSVW